MIALTGPVLACLMHASAYYSVPSNLVAAILRVEGGSVGHITKDADGSYDIGPMQVNSRWLPVLARYRITEPMLRDDACLNIAVGAWILRLAMDGSPTDFWYGVGSYHSHTLVLNRRYSWAVYRALNVENRAISARILAENRSPIMVNYRP